MITGVLPLSAGIALDWLREGRRVVAATLVETIGSAPLDEGAEMLVDDRGHIEGSVTGGCVEAALVDEAQQVLAGAEPRLVRYGISDRQAADVGLMCGGTVIVFVHELRDDASDVLVAVRDAVDSGRAVALATVLEGEHAGEQLAVCEGEQVGAISGVELLTHAIVNDAIGSVGEGRSTIRRYGADGRVMGAEVAVHIQSFATPPSMVIFGAIDFSAALAQAGASVGYEVTICDARPAFVQSSRFTRDAQVVSAWPDVYLRDRELGPRDVVLVFTHDPKFDEPALLAALRTDAGYIGALGSRRTHTDRLVRLREAGVDDAGIARISGPCGLDIGARTPSETAISIMAEILAARNGRPGGRLTASAQPIHVPTADVGREL